MRQIKFRVWDTEENKFFEPVYEAYKGKLLDLSITLSGELCRRTLEICSEHQSMFPDRYILDQYTGLKDKNDVEIYEGDIIQSNIIMYNRDNKKINIVIFEDGIFKFLNGVTLYIITNPSIHFDPEIIGNIHENKELCQPKTK